MNTIEVYTENITPPAWLDSIDSVARMVLQHHNIDNIECSITFCDDAYIAELNQTYRGIEGATDVLSFCTSEGEVIPVPGRNEIPESIGDIVISVDYVKDNAHRFSVPFEEEIRRVVIHGMLHLLGYTHAGVNPDEPMLQKQEQLLQAGERLF